MIVERPSRRYRMRPAASWLIRAFAPGCLTMLRSQSTRRVRGADRLTIVYDLPDRKAMLRAQQLVKGAGSITKIAVGSDTVRDLTATIDGDQLTVEAVLVTK